MNIILLKGVFPLKKKIILSEKWGIVLDNPKSKEEIEFVRNFLKSKVDFQKSKKLEEYFLVSDNKTLLHQKYLENSLKGLEKQHKNNTFFDKKFTTRSRTGNYYDCLVKSWLIVRFDDKGFFRALRKENKKVRKNKGLILLEGNEIGLQREERALKFISIIDLLFLDKFNGSLKKTIILTDDKPMTHTMLMIQINGIAHGRTIHNEFDYFTIPDNLDRIIDLTKRIEKLSNERSEKLLFIGETIKSINEHHLESKMMFLMLIGIIEFLLTHNPNSYRFNVEDSIRKQFQLKTGIVLNKMAGFDLSKTSNRLKLFYDVRSAIAHGDFIAIENIIKKERKIDSDFDIFDLVEEAFNYVSTIVKMYVQEPDFVDSLKKL
ncbi:MAG: hypothetical protein PHV26_01980 [Candidatus Pacebacteria bacterium]|nr:hypothetical protein [Candidatus Paceibacterota bacterium]